MSSGGDIREEKAENDFTQTESVASPQQRPTRRRGCLGFLKKWWWLLLIILIIVTLIVVLPVIFVAVPKIIRKNINEAQLSVQGISTTNTQTRSAHIAINSTIVSSTSRSATIDGFNASLYLEDKLPHTPFIFLNFPQVHSQKVSVVNVSQEVQIMNEQAFADYNSWYLLNESFRVTVDGFTHVHVSGLPSTKVHFQKTVTLTGLNAFKGVNITSSTVNITAQPPNDNFHGTLTIPNPSILTVEIGNTSFSNFLNSTTIGQAFIDNLLLVPGPNTFPIRAAINETPVLDGLAAEPACNTGILPFTFVGQNITNNGQELPYFEQAFRSNVLSLDLNIAADLGINASCATL